MSDKRAAVIKSCRDCIEDCTVRSTDYGKPIPATCLLPKWPLDGSSEKEREMFIEKKRAEMLNLWQNQRLDVSGKLLIDELLDYILGHAAKES